MSTSDAPAPTPTSPPPTSAPPLSWPPPGLEPIHGRLWRIIGILAAGGTVMLTPLLWALAVSQPFWSLGPFEANWQIGMGITVLGMAVLLLGFIALFRLLRQAARAADLGYGRVTIWETAADASRDTGFLIQGRRHFSRFDGAARAGIVRARLVGAFLALAAALWLTAGFAVAVLLAARGYIGAGGIWAITIGPAAALAIPAALLELVQSIRLGAARRSWHEDAGGDASVAEEVRGWQGRLAQAGDQVALAGGRTGRCSGLRQSALGVALLFLLVFVPTATIALTAAVGPILASTALPTFLSVQEMAGAAEVLRAHRVDADPAITPLDAGESLQNLVFVGPGQKAEAMERAPRTPYPDDWFADPDVFPDPYSETVARELMVRSFDSFSADERASLARAAAHPAQAEFTRLAHASAADIVSGRWTLPFADGVSMFDLPWPRFAALRSAGLAHIARAAIALSQGRRDQAEQTVAEVISAGFVLVDEGPTLVDNLTGVQLINLGGDALEELYRRTGRAVEAVQLRAAREASTASARRARVGNTEQDIHTLLRGIPDLVERPDALRGLRWEYLATFNMLAPCINLQKMVFGQDATYDEWMGRAKNGLVRVPGEAALFELARSGTAGAGEDVETTALSRMLTLTLGTRTRPGSCARLLSGLNIGESIQ